MLGAAIKEDTATEIFLTLASAYATYATTC